MPRITIMLPKDLLAELDSAAQELGQSRSQLVCRALRDLLRHKAPPVDEELLAEGYRETAEHAIEVVQEFAALQAAAVEAVSHWDE